MKKSIFQVYSILFLATAIFTPEIHARKRKEDSSKQSDVHTQYKYQDVHPQVIIYHKPVIVLDKASSDGKAIGKYSRTGLGKQGNYGLFTPTGKSQSKTVLEHNNTTTPIPGITDKPAIGYIANTNAPQAGRALGAPSYIALYPYTPPVQVKTVVSHKTPAQQKSNMNVKMTKTPGAAVLY